MNAKRAKPSPAAPQQAKGSVKSGTGLSLGERISAAPRLIDPAAAQTRVGEWLGQIEAADAKALKAQFSANANVGTLIESFAESAPYLWELAVREPGRLLRLLQSDPEEHLAALLAGTADAISETDDEAEAMRRLRRMKAESALLIALADIGGVWPVMRATRALTDVADTAVAAAARFLLADLARNGRLKPADKAQPQQDSGYIVLAMGKMGAFELNYSSDIDLIVFFDPAAPAVVRDIEPAPFFVRMTQRLVRLLQERTVDGYVFRTDLRLRPDPSSTAIAISTGAALSYYEGRGQNWERAALIKARACAGDFVAGERILNDLSPFIWRKYLDFAAVAEVHALKRQINAYRGHGEIAVEGHNIKLGRGGIREIEFFAQTQQLIAGGRNPDLRDRDTLTTLAKLAQDRWIEVAVRDDLSAAYRFLRTVEHRLQMVNDEQTQTLPADRDGLERFARFLGFTGRDDFAVTLLGHLKSVQQHYSRLFEAPAGAGGPPFVFPADSDDRKTLDRLGELGFRAPLQASATVRQWLKGEHASLKSDSAREQLKDLLPVLLEQIARSDNPDAALVRFDQFLGNLRNAARLLPLLRQVPGLIPLVVLVLSIAPRLGDIVARYPAVMDALVDPSFFGALPTDEELRRRFETALSQARYDEDLLERIRMFGLEYMFLIGVRILSGTVTARAAGEAFARIADVVIGAVNRAVAENFARSYGHMRESEAAVIAMGKLGGCEMTATSDLDLILIYDFDEQHPESDGERPLYGGQYFARLTQRLINALTAQTNYGALYQVDMRLRPSGRAGPLASSLRSFANYQDNEAWTWEHMALTRARVVAGSPEFTKRVEDIIREVLQRPRDAALIAGDVVEMRAAIAKEKGDRERWDLKYVAGGLVDIEFIAQYLQLVHAHRLPEILDTQTARVLDKAWQLGVLPVEDAEVLRPAIQLYLDMTQILRLCLAGPFDPKTAGAGLLGLLARAADVPDFATLDATILETQAKVRRSFERILGVKS